MIFGWGISVTGILCILYCGGYIFWNGSNNAFTFVWGVIGIVLFLYGFVHRWILEKGAHWMKHTEQIFLGGMFVCLFVMGILLGILAWEGKKEPPGNADYLVVLGAHVYGERMSTNLKSRVKAAELYLEKNPETKVILSGGKGHGEDITEAEAMRRYLEEQGISSDRIWLEDTSTDTEENIKNSAKLIGDMEKSVVIVSNDFHIFRAKAIAKKQGYKNVEGLGAKTYAYTVPNCYVRELVAVIKYKICGQI